MVPDGNELFLGLAALAVLVAGGITLPGSIRTQMGRYRAPLTATAIIGALAMLGPWTIFPRVLYALPLVAQIRERSVGDKVTLKILRNGQSQDINVTLINKPTTNQ